MASAAPSAPVARGTRTFADALVEQLLALGVEYAFGVFGGGIAPLCHALHRSTIRLLHFRHEAGAAFAAIEASLASGRPVVVLATTGPGLTNLVTGMVAARWEGAKVIFVSGCSAPAQRGRFCFQETSGYAPGLSQIFEAGRIFHLASVIESPCELETVAARMASGVRRPEGFVAHLGLSNGVQTTPVASTEPIPERLAPARTSCDPATLARCLELLARERFVIWTGFGARGAAAQVRALAERSGAYVMSSPRGKGIMPEDHPLYLGVTGLGGHPDLEARLSALAPARTLVLGSRLGEFTSFWSPGLIPRHGFVHVDLSHEVFGAAYPRVPTLGVQCEIETFLDGVLASFPTRASADVADLAGSRSSARRTPRADGDVRPSYLLAVVQRLVVEGSDALVLTEAGNSFALGSQHLRFGEPGRYRVSSGFGSMGHAAAGVVGAALGRGRKAVAIVGDGAMLMLNELSTACAYDVDALWIVLNDARYGMIAHGMESLGWKPFEVDFPRADFVRIARALGARALRVDREGEVEPALREAMRARGPFVVDVRIDPGERAPTGGRNRSLSRQGVGR